MANAATLDFYRQQSDAAYANWLKATKLFNQDPTLESLEDACGAYRWHLSAEMAYRKAGAV